MAFGGQYPQGNTEATYPQSTTTATSSAQKIKPSLHTWLKDVNNWAQFKKAVCSGDADCGKGVDKLKNYYKAHNLAFKAVKSQLPFLIPSTLALKNLKTAFMAFGRNNAYNQPIGLKWAIINQYKKEARLTYGEAITRYYEGLGVRFTSKKEKAAVVQFLRKAFNFSRTVPLAGNVYEEFALLDDAFNRLVKPSAVASATSSAESTSATLQGISTKAYRLAAFSAFLVGAANAARSYNIVNNAAFYNILSAAYSTYLSYIPSRLPSNEATEGGGVGAEEELQPIIGEENDLTKNVPLFLQRLDVLIEGLNHMYIQAGEVLGGTSSLYLYLDLVASPFSSLKTFLKWVGHGFSTEGLKLDNNILKQILNAYEDMSNSYTALIKSYYDFRRLLTARGAAPSFLANIAGAFSTFTTNLGKFISSYVKFLDVASPYSTKMGVSTEKLATMAVNGVLIVSYALMGAGLLKGFGEASLKEVFGENWSAVKDVLKKVFSKGGIKSGALKELASLSLKGVKGISKGAVRELLRGLGLTLQTLGEKKFWLYAVIGMGLTVAYTVGEYGLKKRAFRRFMQAAVSFGKGQKGSKQSLVKVSEELKAAVSDNTTRKNLDAIIRELKTNKQLTKIERKKILERVAGVFFLVLFIGVSYKYAAGREGALTKFLPEGKVADVPAPSIPSALENKEIPEPLATSLFAGGESSSSLEGYKFMRGLPASGDLSRLPSISSEEPLMLGNVVRYIESLPPKKRAFAIKNIVKELEGYRDVLSRRAGISALPELSTVNTAIIYFRSWRFKLVWPTLACSWEKASEKLSTAVRTVFEKKGISLPETDWTKFRASLYSFLDWWWNADLLKPVARGPRPKKWAVDILNGGTVLLKRIAGSSLMAGLTSVGLPHEPILGLAALVAAMKSWRVGATTALAMFGIAATADMISFLNWVYEKATGEKSPQESQGFGGFSPNKPK